ncbi:MAG TPA: hypothetical protein VMA36_17585, partial [Candidatus Limnocylindria bacterium]|nr:hypothetical protein [Candidatus Limnocylindria bacterium]
RPAASLDASSVAYWGPPAREGTPLPVLTVAAGPAGNVRSIEFGYDAAAAALYRGGSRVDDDTETALPIEPAYALGGLKALASTSGTPPALLRTRAFVEPSRAGTSASAYAAALVQESARSALRARVVVDGLVYGTVVTPASLIAVRGAGDAHDGLYYVERVEHEIARRRYTQSIEMTREGLGSTISKAT